MKTKFQAKALGEDYGHEDYLMDKIRTMETRCRFGYCDGDGIIPRLVSLDSHHTQGVISCKCKIVDASMHRYKPLLKAGDIALYKHCRLDTFTPLNPDQEAAHRLISNTPDSFYFMGPMGTGKTHLLASLVNRELSQGRLAALITVPQLIAAIGSSKGAITELERLCYDIPYLALDDMGKEMPTGYMAPKVKDALFRIIDRRNLLFHNGLGHTSFSSQFPRDAVNVPNPNDPGGPLIKAPSLADRMDGATVDRIRDITMKITLSGESLRKGR